MSLWKPTGVSFSGGGARTVGHMGVVAHLLSSGVLSDVRHWYGCSGGAYTAIIGAIGASSAWIQEMVRLFDMTSFGGVDEELLLDFQNTFGVNSGKTLKEIMSRFVDTWEPGASRWTFRDLEKHRPGVSLHITATNLTRGRHHVFNLQNNPDLCIMEALHASSAIPFYFTPWRDHLGAVFCDGGLIETYPWECVADKSNTLVVVCSDIDVCGRPERRPITAFGDYISALGNIITKNKTVVAPRHWIAVNNTSVGFLDFELSEEGRLAFFAEGVAAATAWDAFRRKALSRETHGNRRPSEDLDTLSSSHLTPGKTSDSPQFHSPLSPPCRVPDSRSGERRSGRRWSL